MSNKDLYPFSEQKKTWHSLPILSVFQANTFANMASFAFFGPANPFVDYQQSCPSLIFESRTDPHHCFKFFGPWQLRATAGRPSGEAKKQGTCMLIRFGSRNWSYIWCLLRTLVHQLISESFWFLLSNHSWDPGPIIQQSLATSDYMRTWRYFHCVDHQMNRRRNLQNRREDKQKIGPRPLLDGGSPQPKPYKHIQDQKPLHQNMSPRLTTSKSGLTTNPHRRCLTSRLRKLYESYRLYLKANSHTWQKQTVKVGTWWNLRVSAFWP